VRVARNIAIIALLALIVALVPGGGNAADAIVSAVGIVFLAMIAYTAYRVFRENQYAYLSLDDRHRAMLVIAVGAIVLMIAAADELTRTGLGLIVWLGVLAAAIWAMVIVYQDSRSY
jgi:Kef-type K+ transport system membrane component KefB